MKYCIIAPRSELLAARNLMRELVTSKDEVTVLALDDPNRPLAPADIQAAEMIIYLPDAGESTASINSITLEILRHVALPIVVITKSPQHIAIEENKVVIIDSAGLDKSAVRQRLHKALNSADANRTEDYQIEHAQDERLNIEAKFRSDLRTTPILVVTSTKHADEDFNPANPNVPDAPSFDIPAAASTKRTGFQIPLNPPDAARSGPSQNLTIPLILLALAALAAALKWWPKLFTLLATIKASFPAPPAIMNSANKQDGSPDSIAISAFAPPSVDMDTKFDIHFLASAIDDWNDARSELLQDDPSTIPQRRILQRSISLGQTLRVDIVRSSLELGMTFDEKIWDGDPVIFSFRASLPEAATPNRRYTGLARIRIDGFHVGDLRFAVVYTPGCGILSHQIVSDHATAATKTLVICDKGDYGLPITQQIVDQLKRMTLTPYFDSDLIENDEDEPVEFSELAPRLSSALLIWSHRAAGSSRVNQRIDDFIETLVDTQARKNRPPPGLMYAVIDADAPPLRSDVVDCNPLQVGIPL